MSKSCPQVLTPSEFCRKYKTEKWHITKNKKLFQWDPGFDVAKLFDNAHNQAAASVLLATIQKRPNAKGQKKPRN